MKRESSALFPFFDGCARVRELARQMSAGGGERRTEVKREVSTSQLSTQPASLMRSHTRVLEGRGRGAVTQLLNASTQELEKALAVRREMSQRKRTEKGESEKKRARLPGLPDFGGRPVGDVERFDLTADDDEAMDVGHRLSGAAPKLQRVSPSYAPVGGLRVPVATHRSCQEELPPWILSLHESLALLHSKTDQAHQQVAQMNLYATQNRVRVLEDVASHHTAAQSSTNAWLEALEQSGRPAHLFPRGGGGARPVCGCGTLAQGPGGRASVGSWGLEGC